MLVVTPLMEDTMLVVTPGFPITGDKFGDLTTEGPACYLHSPGRQPARWAAARAVAQAPASQPPGLMLRLRWPVRVPSSPARFALAGIPGSFPHPRAPSTCD
eukprot:CAMPEP_0197388948 /NCGR_PEP_ID=MMETSP1165-20131217/1342_1 /TAXON_ID=284809 /ORGANISM="Chrysocystis fragilis, Strain CCMP3189" /LENGTH=101 /DNA_ID=CAMNT_0042914303 /DNA_START=203 /DNA_END=508 /DNA_ORIENTATION=+